MSYRVQRPFYSSGKGLVVDVSKVIAIQCDDSNYASVCLEGVDKPLLVSRKEAEELAGLLLPPE